MGSLLLSHRGMDESGNIWEVSAHLPIPSTLRCHIVGHRVAQHPARSSTTPSVPVAASSMDGTSPLDNRRMRPPRAEPNFRRLYSSLHHVISIHVSIFLHGASPDTRLGSSNPSPLIQRRFSRSTFGEPAHSPLARASYNSSWKRKIHTLRTASWSRPRRPPRPAHIHHRVLVHAPRQAITTLRPKPSPRAGPRPISTSIRFFSDCFLHTPARNARPAHLPAPSQR
ncbi:hypothetical protein K438DRAFT_1976638 [Mycena galopus ATCC 62051]|nr:hypothetical protein K438DRAFT_1976638 [Mycena galopus ATCC 62051]